jgi:hypothetical protein
MLTFLKYTTIIIAAAVILFMTAMLFSDAHDYWPVLFIIAFYTVILFFLNYSAHKNYVAGYWIAFALCLLPVIGVFVLLAMLSGIEC